MTTLIRSPMLDIENYILAGDHVIATPKSSTANPITGQVLTIVGSTPGKREFSLRPNSSDLLDCTEISVSEYDYIFEVERGDSWVIVPPYLTLDEAEAKCARSQHNAHKRVLAAVPLFADQVALEAPTVEVMTSQAAARRRDELERDDRQAAYATELHRQVQSKVSPEQFQRLAEVRSRLPRNPAYGVEFWQSQLLSIQHPGEPRLSMPAVPANWKARSDLLPDQEVTWLSAKGPRKARVLYVGNSIALVKIVGQAVADFDPREFPNGNAWVVPTELRTDIEPATCRPA